MARQVYKYEITLTGKEKHDLRQAKHQGQQKARLIIRILIILLAAQGKTIAATAVSLSCSEQTVLNQRKRFRRPSRGWRGRSLARLTAFRAPPHYTAQQHALITATVCATLKDHELPLSRLSTSDLLRVVHQQEGLAEVSQSTLARHLQQQALKPWQYRYWLFPRDPDFVNRACHRVGFVCGLLGRPETQPERLGHIRR